MAFDPAELLRQHSPLPEAPEAPGAPLAGTRGQAIQRLQVGLFGLAAMVLLVALANIIMNNAEHNQATVVPEAAPTMAGEQGAGQASDPLAGAGVVPETPAEQPAAEGNARPPRP